MEKIKLLIILSFSFVSQAQSPTITDLKNMEKKGDSLNELKKYEEASKLYEKLVQVDPKSFNYNFKYAVSFGQHVESLPRFQQVKLVRQMIKHFEAAFDLNRKDIAINRALLEIYLRVPRFFGGGNKKAKSVLENIYSISETEGDKARKFYDNFWYWWVMYILYPLEAA